VPRIRNPILCYVSDRRRLPREQDGLAAVMERAAAAGVDWIQIREKDLPTAQLAELTREAKRRVRVSGSHGGTRVIVNDRLDVAIAADAGGVHLGEMSLPPIEVVRWLRSPEGRIAAGEDFLVGVSCHSVAAARGAANADVDYLFFGPVFMTPAKAEFGAPQGLERLAEVCSAVTIPVLAIGGITVDNAGACFAAGASGLAAIRMFQESRDLRETVGRLREAASPMAQ